jgi:carbonic anhydrase/acetyltransferase-like protein (isoleucine patch superfamily)
VVSPKSVIPPRSLVIGTPARVIRSLDEKDINKIQGIAREYLELMEIYSDMQSKVTGYVK